MLPLEDSDVIN